VQVEIVELNAWTVAGRWHFDHSPLRGEMYVTAIYFHSKHSELAVEGWLPLRPNVRPTTVTPTTDGLLVNWPDSSQARIYFKRVEGVYWDALSGVGHTDEQMAAIRSALGAA
jgi:hypothetical protein